MLTKIRRMKSALPFLLVLLSCQKSQPQTDTIPAGFLATPVSSAIKGGAITEASGIADSKLFPGSLWVQEDSGNPPQLLLLAHDGALKDSVFISGATNRDWE